MLIKVLSLFLLLAIGGCSILENVGGYDLSACQGSWDVCWQLYLDNKEKL